MNYEKIYYDLCASRQMMQRTKGTDIYYESHHIKPKSIFPELKHDKTNLVLLTPREHHLAHLLLIRFLTGDAKFKMICAYCRFCHGKNAEPYKNSKEYEKYRLEWHKGLGERLKGHTLSPEAKAKMIITRRKHDGYKVSSATKDKMRQNALKQFSTEESKKLHSERMKNYYAEHPETHTGVYKGHKFGPPSAEKIEKLRAAMKSWECVETGDKYTGSELATVIGVSYPILKKKFIKNNEVNYNDHKYIRIKIWKN